MPGLRSGKPSSGRRRNLGKASTLIISSLLLEAPIRCASFPLEYAGGTYRKRPRLGPVGRTVPRSERRVELSAVSRTTNCANKTASMANPPPAFAGAFPPPPPAGDRKVGRRGPDSPLLETNLPPTITRIPTNPAFTSLAGLLLATYVLYNLGIRDETASGVDELMAQSTGIILDVALPQSASDVISIFVSEGIAGGVGFAATTAVTKAMSVTSTSYATEAIAGTEYFLTRSVAFPVLLSLGLSPVLSIIGSVLLASIPYELVKYEDRLQQTIKAEDDLLGELLREEREKGGERSFDLKKNPFKNLFTSGKSTADQVDNFDVANLQPATNFASILDIPELLTDVIKWLEYDVLKSQFGGMLLSLNGVPLSSGAESAVFGFMAGLSSQLYQDALYQNTDLGPEEKAVEARTRNNAKLLAMYATTCFSTAALFCTYESVKVPAKLFLSGLISGGYAGCAGSEYFDLCVDSFEWSSPAIVPDAASIQAEFRGLVVILFSLFQSWFGVFLDYTDAASIQAEFRALAVVLFSLFQSWFGIFLD